MDWIKVRQTDGDCCQQPWGHLIISVLKSNSTTISSAAGPLARRHSNWVFYNIWIPIKYNLKRLSLTDSTHFERIFLPGSASVCRVAHLQEYSIFYIHFLSRLCTWRQICYGFKIVTLSHESEVWIFFYNSLFIKFYSNKARVPEKLCCVLAFVYSIVFSQLA